jgi:hypothetical protein
MGEPTSAEEPAPVDDAAFLETWLSVLALRLKHEVALTRALRGPDRQEGFLGLFLTEDDAQAMLDELTGRIAVTGGGELTRRIAQVEDELRRHRAATPGLALARIAGTFHLTEPEVDLLLLACAPAVDPRFGRVYGFLNDDMGRRWLTPALAHRLLGRHGIDLPTLRVALGPERPLLRHGLLTLAPGEPMIDSAIGVPESIVDRLIGVLDGDPVLRLYTRSYPTVAAGIDVDGSIGQDVVVLVGRDAGAAALAAAAPRPLVRLPYARLAHLDPGEAREIVRAVLRAAHLDDALPYLAGFTAAPPRLRADLARLVVSPAVLDAPRSGMWEESGLVAPEHDAPSPGEARLRLLMPDAPESLRRADGIPLLDRMTLAEQHDGDALALLPVLRARAALTMDALAQPVVSTYRFDDLVLPRAALGHLADFVAWQSHAPRVLDEWGMGSVFARRHGSVALFRGPSGTGKTMAASVVANALGRPLYRVELAGLVSKYIGETEKNLERVFEAASRSDVVLFFDEADALFGKRAEVTDAHDRYANLETAYLLQRIEAQDGAVILATNLQENIDAAFLRRFDLVVEFPAPGPADRLRLWRRLELTRVPLAAGIDYGFLARAFELTGGEIRNAILAAAHAAARDDTALGMGHLVRAVAQELQKLGRPLRRQSFEPHYLHLRERSG